MITYLIVLFPSSISLSLPSFPLLSLSLSHSFSLSLPFLTLPLSLFFLSLSLPLLSPFSSLSLSFSSQALNRAGLSTIASSRMIIFDSTPPCAGTVFDGPKPENGFLDLDYSSDFTRIQAHWEDFTDPHTDTTEYWWSIGTCPNCTNVMPFISVGLAKGKEN